MTTTTIPATEARTKLRKLLDEVDEAKTRVIITKKGRAKAALISIDELEGWEETLDILANRDEVAAIRRGLADIARSKFVPWEASK
jgi:prevent-host-death family protein